MRDSSDCGHPSTTWPAGHPSTTWPAGHPSTTWPAGHSSTTLSHPRGTHSVDSLNVSHCPTWQCSDSLTCHCRYSADAVTTLRGSTLTLSRATAAALHHCLTWHCLSLCHCIYTAITASRGSTLTLSRATAAALHHCSHCLTWQ